MSTTAYHYEKLKTLDRLAKLTGFKVLPLTGWNQSFNDNLSLIPETDKLPIYSRDAVLMNGTAEDLIAFIIGWQKSLEYINMLGICNQKKIERKEQDYRNKELARLIKYGKEKTNDN